MPKSKNREKHKEKANKRAALRKRNKEQYIKIMKAVQERYLKERQAKIEKKINEAVEELKQGKIQENEQ